MKNIMIATVLCAAHLTSIANNRTHIKFFQRDSMCVCKKDSTLSCCKKNSSTYYGNPLTLSAKEKMKYGTMQVSACCKHNKKERAGKNKCANCKKEAIKSN